MLKQIGAFVCVLAVSIFGIQVGVKHYRNTLVIEKETGYVEAEGETVVEDETPEPEKTAKEEKKDYIKWIDFGITSQAMNDAYEYDVESYNSEVQLKWIELLAYLGAKYGGNFKNYKKKDLDHLVDRLVNQKETMESITKDMKYYDYYYFYYYCGKS